MLASIAAPAALAFESNYDRIETNDDPSFIFIFLPFESNYDRIETYFTTSNTIFYQNV